MLVLLFLLTLLFLCFSVLLVLRLPRSGKREIIIVLLVRLFGLCLFGFVGFIVSELSSIDTFKGNYLQIINY